MKFAAEVSGEYQNNEVIKVSMADLKVAFHPSVLMTLGLGSCVGIALYDPTVKVIGLAHVMLPSSLQSKKRENLAKFADTAIDRLLELMEEAGARKASIVAKLAGGAQMFSFYSTSDIMRIGERNIEAVKEKLKEHQIRIVAEDLGGSYGRTVELHSEDGRLLIKTIGHGIKEI